MKGFNDIHTLIIVRSNISENNIGYIRRNDLPCFGHIPRMNHLDLLTPLIVDHFTNELSELDIVLYQEYYFSKR